MTAHQAARDTRDAPSARQEGTIMTAATTTTRTLLQRRSREALSALAVEFLLGMAVNLLPGDESVVARVLHSIVLGLHILVGIGVVVVAIRLLAAARQEDLGRTEALWALVAVSITFVAGVLTVVLHSGWFSFLMSAGFLVSAMLYVRTLLVGTARPIEA
jgi:hypothetical protein